MPIRHVRAAWNAVHLMRDAFRGSNAQVCVSAPFPRLIPAVPAPFYMLNESARLRAPLIRLGLRHIHMAALSIRAFCMA